MAKIQHKRSLVTEADNTAKKPLPGQTEYGELCVNYNAGDPSLFIKDSSNVIRKVGGSLDVNLDGNVENLDFDLAYVPDPDKGTINATNATSGDVIATVDLPLADATNAGLFKVGVHSDFFLRLDGSNDQDISSDLQFPLGFGVTGESTFTGITTHENGVRVTGGPQADGNIIGNADGSLVLNSSNRITLTSAADAGTGISIRVNNLDKTANVIGLGITTGQTGRTANTTLNQVYSNLDTDYGSNAYAYVARSTATHTAADVNITGYYTALNESDAPNGDVFAFVSAGDAPSKFGGLTEHAGGVSVTGKFDGISSGGVFDYTSGSGVRIRNFENGSNLLLRPDKNVIKAPAINDSIGLQSFVTIPDGTTLTAYEGFRSAPSAESGSGTITNLTGFNAIKSNTLTGGIIKGYGAASSLTDGTTASYGFWSDIGTGTTGNNYNFYAAGTAPNYFRGFLTVGSDPDLVPANATSGTGLQVRPEAIVMARQSNTPTDPLMLLNRISTSDTANYIHFNLNGAFIDSIRADGAGNVMFGSTSDYRTKENIVDLPSAVDVIKGLRPVNFNYTWASGKTRPGFIAHEVAETFPVAVVGEKDGEEAIGTLADYDGTQLETNVTEPEELTYEEQVEVTPYVAADPDNDVEEQEATYTTVTRTKTWTATGTQPVYQGVDQTKLIPLLTKALQEALDKIETLETRLSDAGIA